MSIMMASRTECEPLLNTTEADLNLNAVREHIETAVKRRGYTGETETETYLVKHNCAVLNPDGSLTPTIAGIILFGRAPEYIVTNCGIDIAQFNGSRVATNKLILSRQIRGDLITIIDRTVDLLWARTEHRTRIEGTERIEDHAYADVVLRELTVNALLHRDWSYEGAHVRIQIFTDRIEWISPGGFPGRTVEPVTLETLLNAQVARNPSLAQILYYAGKVESFGMGIDSVLDAIELDEGRQPEVFDNNDIFMFRVFAKKLRADDIAVSFQLTSRQQRIVNQITARKMCSPTELYEVIGENERSIRRDIQRLLDLGLIVVEGATNRRVYRLADD